MRNIAVLIFALLATAAVFSPPYWAGAVDLAPLVSGPELKLAERFIQDLRDKNYSDATAITEPVYRPKDSAILQTLSSLFPARKEKAFHVRAWHKMVMNGQATTQIELFYDFGPDGVVRGVFTVFEKNGAMVIRGANIRGFPAGALQANDFKLPTSALDIRWIFLGVGILFDVFAFATFALCLMSPIVRWRWRWLWLLFVLAGAIRFNLDWTTLESEFHPAMFLAPPAGFYQFFAYGSWVLTITAPIGAAIYWAKRVQWRTDADAPDFRNA